MIKKIALGLLAAFAAFIVAVLIAASLQSDTMSVTRSATIKAPPEAVFAVVNDFRQWDAWSPWSKLDPAMTKSLEGPPQGVGAIYRWSGNNEVGEGSTTLVESKPNEKVGLKLAFIRPFAGEADVQLTFVPKDGGTEVTWAMQSPKIFLAKVMSLFMDCEKICGDQFLEGLENLRRIVEGA